ncbi:MAG: PspC family transcriptional regulator [Bacteroidetes bacterium]|nr:PspC family transcriptional regulator [Bacteroidota bacterium]
MGQFNLVDKFKELTELKMFGVFSALGDKMGIASSRIRMFFIYITFLTIGSPIIFYLIAAFVINIGNYIRNRKRNPIWDF